MSTALEIMAVTPLRPSAGSSSGVCLSVDSHRSADTASQCGSDPGAGPGSLTAWDAVETFLFLGGGALNAAVIIARHRAPLAAPTPVAFIRDLEFWTLVLATTAVSAAPLLLLLLLSRCLQVTEVLIHLMNALGRCLNLNALALVAALHPPHLFRVARGGAGLLLTFLNLDPGGTDSLVGAALVLALGVAAAYPALVLLVLLAKADALAFLLDLPPAEWTLQAEGAAMAQVVINVWALLQTRDPVPVDERTVQLFWERVRGRTDLSIAAKFVSYHRRRHIAARTLIPTPTGPRSSMGAWRLLWWNMVWATVAAGLLGGAAAGIRGAWSRVAPH